ncbi:T9SS type A sorting domain-containing protein [Hymenobacter sp. BT18]|uniref:T9SS type A sorting domain-containing protein n=1 Tax=Hymenobacter sp. BT18 TaxID=2835648 RepID=UPI00143E9EF0|nr:T9SS type A sorting domain-containing protein [Hymenobacter sp. BT18]QIX61182.1 T9SS type A sorting domain-containing protein [Hymenobacter sp. BT18]
MLQTATLDNLVATANTNTVTFTLPTASSGRTYQLTSRLTSCSNDKFDVIAFSSSPVLSLTASQSGSTVSGTVCPNTTVRLTAAVNGETPPAGTIYTFYTINASGTETILKSSTDAFADVVPTTSTNYYVRANTTTCGNNTVQTINVATNQITVASNAVGAVCPGTPVTISANNLVANSSYTLVNAAGTTVATATSTTGGTVSFTVTPSVTTTYTVRGAIPSCSSGAAQGSITVNANSLSLTSNDADNTISRDTPQSVTLAAANGASGSTYTWTATIGATTTTLPTTTSSITVTPQRTTTYAVTGTTAAGNCTSTQNLTITVTGTLPVELTGFKAVWSAAGPRIVWATASERDNHYFEVQRSIDGQTFVAVGKRSGAGSTVARTDYSYVDEAMAKAPFARLYYRLKQVDRNGTAALSDVSTVQVPVSGRPLQVTAYPNPFEQTLKVSLGEAATGTALVRVYDMMGKLLLTQTLSTKAGVSVYEVSRLSSLAPGLYYLSVRQGEQQQMLKVRRR